MVNVVVDSLLDALLLKGRQQRNLFHLLVHFLFQLHLHLAGGVVEKLLKVGFEDFIDYIGEGVRSFC